MVTALGLLNSDFDIYNWYIIESFREVIRGIVAMKLYLKETGDIAFTSYVNVTVLPNSLLNFQFFIWITFSIVRALCTYAVQNILASYKIFMIMSFGYRTVVSKI